MPYVVEIDDLRGFTNKHGQKVVGGPGGKVPICTPRSQEECEAIVTEVSPINPTKKFSVVFTDA